ncbi:protein ROH1 [Beta vulgaris subsp. vulgaris]|uniref:protein ROH1 n=1 Tax=Beta vulgaris subsp. vulgaris TaxID=3555 RepID=UPI0020375309|nr:protein ROH1 [Beta vulgaris subsp. vulgaris]
MWAGGADNQGNFLGRISIRRNQVASMEGEVEDLELFQRKISDSFSDLLPPNHKRDSHHAPPLPPSLSLSLGSINSPIATDSDGESTPFAGSETLLSIAWVRKLLDAFLSCEAEFKAVLLVGREPSQIAKSPLDRLIPDLLDRAVKALDICNAITHGVDAIKFMQTQAQIVVSALEQRPFTDGQIKRARRALGSLLSSIVVDEKENTGKSTERSWSFGKRTSGASSKDRHHAPSFKSLSWCVAKQWSAAKQVQSISSNLNPPRGGESTGLALTVYIMNVVLVFVMWALVAAIPCQDRAGLGTHIPVPKQSNWAHGMCGIQEKIAEEWKRKEKKGSAGLMEEVVKIEKLAQSLVDFADNFQFPMEEEKEAEFAAQVAELAEICRKMDDGLDPLQIQIRELFHRLVKSRTFILDVLDQAGKSSTPNV